MENNLCGVQGVRWGTVGTVSAGYFLHGKEFEPALIIVCSSVVDIFRLIKGLVMFV
jgi:hypothetical protein